MRIEYIVCRCELYYLTRVGQGVPKLIGIKMISSYAQLPPITIPNGTAVSALVRGVYMYHDAVGLMFYSPATLPESVYFEINQDENATETSTGWVALQSYASGALANVVLPAAGCAQVYQEVVFSGCFRLRSTTNVAADRVFTANKVWTT